MGGLEEHYAGDPAWQVNVEAARRQHWTGARWQREVVEAVGGDEDLAAVLVAKVGDGCLPWIDDRVPALGGRTPRSCLGDATLERRLREALMRMD